MKNRGDGMKVTGQPLGHFQANAYIVHDEQSGQAIVIDPGSPDDWLLSQIKDLKVSYILLTHAHFDHIGGLAAVKEATDAPILIHEAEKDWLTDPELNGSGRWPGLVEPIVAPAADRLLTDGDTIHFAGREIEVRHVPGHSPGGVSFILDNICFSGDALFYRSIGRTDLPGSDGFDVLVTNIRVRLLTLPDETTVLPGHGPHTTIGDERKFNPFLTKDVGFRP